MWGQQRLRELAGFEFLLLRVWALACVRAHTPIPMGSHLPKIRCPLPHLFFQVLLMGFPSLRVLTAPLKLWVEYRSCHDALACPSHDVSFASGPGGLPTAWGVWGSSQDLARVWPESSLCRPRESQPLFLPAGPPGPPPLVKVWCTHRVPHLLPIMMGPTRGAHGHSHYIPG